MNGEGLVGPNLTDDYWIHGGGIKDIFKTIKYGWPEKGMISWESQITPMEMQQISSFIITIKGTNPANPKAPEGTIYVEPAALDTTVKALASDTLKVL
jgi:cytochrome c oxidase cbb3-type subunit 3